MKALMFAAWIGGCGADAASTHLALSRGAHEVVLTQSPVVNSGVIAGEALYGTWALQRLHKTHPKLAVVIGIGAGVVRASLAARNVVVSR